MILLIDNYDSFVYNLARYLEELGYSTEVVRNDAVTADDIRGGAVCGGLPEAIILSPGPRDPEGAGVSLEVARVLGPSVPILGVCLGHQVIGAAWGAAVVRGRPVHGRTSRVFHDGLGAFRGLPNPFRAARYHSLVIEPGSVPPPLEVTAWSEDGTIMGVRHRSLPVTGIQFHPESVLSEHGHCVLKNFLETHSVAPPLPGTRSA